MESGQELTWMANHKTGAELRKQTSMRIMSRCGNVTKTMSGKGWAWILTHRDHNSAKAPRDAGRTETGGCRARPTGKEDSVSGRFREAHFLTGEGRAAQNSSAR